MCGICGMVGISEKELLQRMCNVIHHRGSDDEGKYVDNDVAIGMSRLSIIDIAGGQQPISNEDGTLWIVYNGEIYNYKEIKTLLAKKGHRFTTSSDTEMIVHAYEEYGDRCVQHFNGMFAFAIWDNKRKELFLARDRIGIKPLFYWKNKHYFLFSSEIKAILQDKRFDRKINFTALDNYLSRLSVWGEGTIFDGIYKLPPAHTLKYKNGQFTINKYWELDFSRKLHKSEEYFCNKLYELLKESVRRRLIADVPIGAFLSGGIDSTGIVGLMHALCNKSVKTFSMGFVADGTKVVNELPYAKRMAEYFDTEHYEFVMKPNDLIQDIPQMIWHFDEPFAGSLTQYSLCRLAREYVKVILCGTGGDELFGSYGRSFIASDSFNSKTLTYMRLPRPIQNCIKQLFKFPFMSTCSNSLWQRAKNIVEQASHLGELYSDTLLVNYPKLLKNELYRPWLIKNINIRDTLSNLFQRYLDKTNASEFMDKIFYLDLKTQLVDEYLHKHDILSMAWSLEMRVPFLDHELVEFVARIPSHFRSKRDNEKYLLKKTLSRLIPSEPLTRPKAGFSLPYDSWLRSELKDAVMELLSPENIKKRDYFEPHVVSRLIDEHMNREKDHTYRIWGLLMFEIWHRIYIDDHSYTKEDVFSF